MLSIISLSFLALAVSLDGFGVGMTYGLRRIRIPFLSIMIISGCSGLIFWMAMQLGGFASKFLSPHVATVAGALILIGVGIWALTQIFRNKSGTESPEEHIERSLPSLAVTGKVDVHQATLANESNGEIRTVVVIEWKRIGLVIQILRKPALADMDRSGIISASEAVLLGIALSLDAFGAGIGAAFIGFTSLLTALLIACSSGFFIATGLRVGTLCADRAWMKNLSFLPGVLLIIMGLMKLL
jgi:putative Mn2+ efflux pump MntP